MVSLINKIETKEGQIEIRVSNRSGVWRYYWCQTTGRDDVASTAELRVDPGDEPVNQSGVAVDAARLQRLDG